MAGTTAYPRIIDWQKMREIADSVGAWLAADISHISGLIVAGEHPSPAGIADVIMTTTHKTLRGPRGALILANGNPSNPLKKYMLVDCQSALSAGEPVVIDGSGAASHLVSTSIGQVGVIVAAAAGSDTAAWAQITGDYTDAFGSCEISTALGVLIAHITTDSTASYFDIDSSGGNIVQGARAMSSGSTATSPFAGAKAALFTVRLSQGGAFVNGVSQNLISS